MRRAALAAVALLAPVLAQAKLMEDGFRAVPVALTRHPITAMAVAPDGRLFATIQALAQTTVDAPLGTAEIRTFTAWSATDGSQLDEGTVWATVDGVRATNGEEGLLGLALAPDFAASGLVYVYLTTTDESVNQHVRVYRDMGDGTGQYLGTVATSLEPPAEQTSRNGAHLTFGADGCLYVGVGDNGGGNRWNAQLLAGTENVSGGETTAWCTSVCLGPTEYPARTITTTGAPNLAGKVLRLAVEGASTAQPGPSPALPEAPAVFGTGLRNPTGLLSHPLTGQLWAAERGDALQAEVDVVAAGANLGWPCLEGAVPAQSAACLVGHTADEVYAQHPDWTPPVVAHTIANLVLTGIAAYTGLGYPAEYYGDVFYLLRDSARIYRVDLDAPCFLPGDALRDPLPFHDSTQDGDFRAVYDTDDDGDFDVPSFGNLVALAQGPSPFGTDVLYVAGRQSNSSDMQSDAVVFRLEYAKPYLPYDGPAGRVPDACFADGLENPFQRATCMAPGGPCPGQPDGTSCEDGNPCNGAETCQAGICRHGDPSAQDGQSCAAGDACHAAGTCAAGACVQGPALPDGTSCADADPCNGREACVGGACQAGSGPAPLTGTAVTVKPTGGLVLKTAFAPTSPPDPGGGDVVTLRLASGGATLFESALDQPGGWRRSRVAQKYRDPRGSAGGLTKLVLTSRGSSVGVAAAGRSTAMAGFAGGPLDARVVVGEECFAATVSCARKGRALRCGGR